MISAGPSFSTTGQKNNTGKLAALGIWILIAYAIVRSLFAAASKPFWYDEVFTLIVARQPSLSAIWRALAQPADSQVPPFYLVERAAAALLHNPHIGFRLPAICGFACTLVFVFLFVKRRSGALYALLCTSMLLLTVAYTTYAVEARAYSLLVACIALALLCYQRAPEPRWLVLMDSVWPVQRRCTTTPFSPSCPLDSRKSPCTSIRAACGRACGSRWSAVWCLWRCSGRCSGP